MCGSRCESFARVWKSWKAYCEWSGLTASCTGNCAATRCESGGDLPPDIYWSILKPPRNSCLAMFDFRMAKAIAAMAQKASIHKDKELPRRWLNLNASLPKFLPWLCHILPHFATMKSCEVQRVFSPWPTLDFFKSWRRGEESTAWQLPDPQRWSCDMDMAKGRSCWGSHRESSQHLVTKRSRRNRWLSPNWHQSG